MAESSFESLRFPKDVRIDDVILITHSQELISVYDIFTELNVYEDIFENSLSGEIILNEVLNLPSNAPLTGNEKIFLSFYTPEQESNKISLFMNIYKISDRVFMNDKKQSYTLYFTSKEIIKDKVTKVSEAFQGTHSSIARKIFTGSSGLNSDKTLEVEDSRFQTKVIIPRWNPIKAINWLAQRSVSNLNGAVNYMFFETADGYNFKTLTSLISEEPKDTYSFRPHGFHDQKKGGSSYPLTKEDAKSIESYTVRSHFDVIKKLNNGMFASRILVHDLTNRQFKDFTYDYQASFDPTQKLEEGSFVPNSPNLDEFKYNEAFDSNIHILPEQSFLFDESLKDVKKYKEWLLQRQSEMEQYNNVVVDITISGDSSRRVGDVLNIILPSQERFDEGQFIEDKLLSGKYIITAIRHKVQKDNYVSILELTKDSFFNKIPQ